MFYLELIKPILTEGIPKQMNITFGRTLVLSSNNCLALCFFIIDFITDKSQF